MNSKKARDIRGLSFLALPGAHLPMLDRLEWVNQHDDVEREIVAVCKALEFSKGEAFQITVRPNNPPRDR